MIITDMHSHAHGCNVKFEYNWYPSEKTLLKSKCTEFVLYNEAYREYGTKKELGSVWGTSVTVPVTISTS